MNSNLSNAENNVCTYLSRGMTNGKIAEALFVEEKTVKFHLTNIYKKLGVQGRSEAILKLNNLSGMINHQDVPLIQYQSPQEMNQMNEPKRAEVLPHKGNPQGVVQNKPAMTQVEKVEFIDKQFKMGAVIDHLHTMMKEVTKQDINPNTVNSACNCIARMNETVNTCIQAARFLNER